MRMAGQRERHAVRHLGEISGSCTIRITGSSVCDLGHRAGQIVDAAETVAAEPVGDLVADSGEPEPCPARRAEPHRFPAPECRPRAAPGGSLQRRTTSRDCRGSQTPSGALSRVSSRRPDRMRHRLSHEVMGGDDNRRAAARCRSAAHWRCRRLADRSAHIGTAGMQIGDDGDRQTLTRRPARGDDIVRCHRQPFAGFEIGVAGSSRAREREQPHAGPQKLRRVTGRVSTGSGVAVRSSIGLWAFMPFDNPSRWKVGFRDGKNAR